MPLRGTPSCTASSLGWMVYKRGDSVKESKILNKMSRLESHLPETPPAPVPSSSSVLIIVLSYVISWGTIAAAQLTKTGACPPYQTDRSFDVYTASKLYDKTLYFTHALPNTAEANHTCTKLTFSADHTFKYDYVDASGILTYYNGQWSVFPTTVTSPGTIILQFKYMNILGSDVTGRTTLYALYSTGDKMLTMASCNEQPFNYRKEYMYTLATAEVARLPLFYELQKTLLVTVGAPNSRQLRKVIQDCF